MSVDLSVFKDAAPYRHFRPEDWALLESALQQRRVKAGEVVFREGDPGDGLFWVRSGKVRVRRMVVPEGRGREKTEQLLTFLTAGSVFGEMSLAGEEPRSADVVAETDAVLYHLPKAGYEALKRDAPATALRVQDLLVGTLCGRLREALRGFEIIQFWLA